MRALLLKGLPGLSGWDLVQLQASVSMLQIISVIAAAKLPTLLLFTAAHCKAYFA